jgi:hypothetical protein
MPNQDAIFCIAVPLIGILLPVLCLVFSLRSARRRRLVENLPTSKTTGVFIGLVEIKGTAESEQPLTSYLAGQSCVYYGWSISEHWSRTVTETYTDEKGNIRTRTRQESGWTTVASGGESVPFYLQDDCGVILVRPDGAKIEANQVVNFTCDPSHPFYYGKGPATAVANSDYRRCFVENAIPLHATLYVMGQAREREDVVAAEIANDPNAEMFLISMRTEEQVGSALKWKGRGLALLGLVLVVGASVAVTQMSHRSPEADLPKWIASGAIYLAIWFIGWIIMMFNSMVKLRQRVQQAWANVDVQLKRRNDLIPNLVEITKGLRDYEQNLQTELAQLRSQLAATPPGQPGADPHACSGYINVIIERYPELKANGSFTSLHKELVNTENRISLARGYFNDIATFYNTRLEVIPDRFIAALGAMKPRALMTADEFEREPVKVNLVQ